MFVIDCKDDAHCLFTVLYALVIGIPACKAANLPLFAPPNSIKTVPVQISSIASIETPLFSNLSLVFCKTNASNSSGYASLYPFFILATGVLNAVVNTISSGLFFKMPSNALLSRKHAEARNAPLAIDIMKGNHFVWYLMIGKKKNEKCSPSSFLFKPIFTQIIAGASKVRRKMEFV